MEKTAFSVKKFEVNEIMHDYSQFVYNNLADLKKF